LALKDGGQRDLYQSRCIIANPTALIELRPMQAISVVDGVETKTLCGVHAIHDNDRRSAI